MPWTYQEHRWLCQQIINPLERVRSIRLLRFVKHLSFMAITGVYHPGMVRLAWQNSRFDYD